MTRKTITCMLGLALLFSAGIIAAENNWPHWRGPGQFGISDAENLPLKWSSSENVKWKTALPSWSAATPIIWGNRIFITSPSKAEAKPKAAAAEATPQNQRRRRRPSRDPGGSLLFLYCISKTDGKILWQRELDNKNQIHRKQNDASPSPVTDGTHVWVVTGTGVVSAYDMEGKLIWQKKLQEEYGTFGLNWGYASSPLLFEGNLIVEVLHGHKTDDPSYIISFDGKSGKINWRVERPTDALMESPDAYTTPVLHEKNGKKQIIISGADYVTGHDPGTGKEIWRAGGLNPLKRRNYRVVGTPIISGDLLFVPTRKKPVQVFRIGQNGQVSDESLAWKYEGSGTSDVPSPISDGKYFYIVDDRGMITCLDRETGDPVWGPTPTVEGIVSASPVIAGKRMYIINENGVTSVVSTGPEFKLLATNELDGGYTLASSAVSGSEIFIRTATHLYCIK